MLSLCLEFCVFNQKKMSCYFFSLQNFIIKDLLAHFFAFFSREMKDVNFFSWNHLLNWSNNFMRLWIMIFFFLEYRTEKKEEYRAGMISMKVWFLHVCKRREKKREELFCIAFSSVFFSRQSHQKPMLTAKSSRMTTPFYDFFCV